jgi:hypothetical protein
MSRAWCVVTTGSFSQAGFFCCQMVIKRHMDSHTPWQQNCFQVHCVYIVRQGKNLEPATHGHSTELFSACTYFVRMMTSEVMPLVSRLSSSLVYHDLVWFLLIVPSFCINPCKMSVKMPLQAIVIKTKCENMLSE